MPVVNVIDRRENPYECENISAVYQPSWTLNSRGGNQYEQAEGWCREVNVTTVSKAIAMFDDDPTPITCFLYDLGQHESVDEPSMDEIEREARKATLERMQYEKGEGWIIDLRSKFVPYMACLFRDMLKEQDAENYVEFEVVHPEDGPILVRIQKKWGKSPGEIARREIEWSNELEKVIYNTVTALRSAAQHHEGAARNALQSAADMVETTLTNLKRECGRD